MLKATRMAGKILKTWGAYLLGARMHTLSASVAPVLVGSALVYALDAFDVILFGLTLLATVLVQVGANYTDEYADHDQTASLGKFPAPHKVLARGLLTTSQVKEAAAWCFGLATLIGSYLVWHSGWTLLWVCLASLAVAFAYSAGPWRLGDKALGEVLVFVFMGPVIVLGTVYVPMGRMEWEGLWLSLPLGALVAAILLANNLRDYDEDRVQGRSTLVTHYGTRWGRVLYMLLMLLAYMVPPALMGAGYGGAWLWLPWLTAPLAWQLVNQVWEGGDPTERHGVLRKTSLLHLLYGVLLALAVLADAWASHP